MKYFCRFPFLTLLLFSGCVSYSYVAPDNSDAPAESYSRVIEKPFDQTWSALMQYAGSAYFDIQQFEKQSGLLVLSFVGSTPSEFITGGHWKATGALFFDGDYVDFCVKYREGVLEDRVNIIVTSVDSARTKVTVRAHYVFTVGNPEAGMESWAFDSGTSDAHPVTGIVAGTDRMITMRPTYKVERSILDAVEGGRIDSSDH